MSVVARRSAGPTPSGWWQRNRLWVLLLVPLLVLAAAASSFRLQRIYLPWDWTRPHATAASSMVFEQRERVSSAVTVHRRVAIDVNGVVPVRTFQGGLAAPGAVLYAVQLQLTADPGVPLAGCEVALWDADGVEYRPGAAIVDDPAQRGTPPLSVQCVPLETPGPLVGFDGQLVPAEAERPRTWRVDTAIALPEDVRPDRVVVRWSRPDYAVLTLSR